MISAGVWYVAGRDGGDGTPGEERVEHAKGGIVRIAVTTPPELGDRSSGGDVLRSLVLPKLFKAQPDGTWRASLVEPGSDRLSKDKRSASFRLRENASWSDGSPITATDLEQSKDDRFVEGVEADDEGRITVRFTHALDGWRRLWSGADSVVPADPSLYGGPYVVDKLTSGWETILKPNPRWYGDNGGPFLDEIHLVIAADPTMARQLLADQRVDVVAPVADTARTAQLQDIDGVAVDVEQRTGAWVALRANSTRLTNLPRLRVLANFPRQMFVNGLLHEEARLIDGFRSSDDPTWAQPSETPPTPYAPLTMSVSTPMEEPLAPLLQSALRRVVAADESTLTVRSADRAGVRTWLETGDYQFLLQTEQDGPEMCWTCSLGGIDFALAEKADGGDDAAAKALEEKARAEGLVLPLWRPYAVVGYRNAAVRGVEANGFVGSAAWNADTWWRP